MLTQALYRLGRGAARRPWRVIAVWLLVAVAAGGAAVALGGRTTDTITAPGVDSQRASDLLRSGGSDRSGLTAQVVVTPVDPAATFFASEPARRSLARLQAEVRSLPHVLGTTDPAAAVAAGRATPGLVSADGRIALIQVQYPEQAALTAADLTALEAVRTGQPADSPVRVEMGGGLYATFGGDDGSVGELVGIVVAGVILLIAFGSLVAAAMPIGMAVLGLAVGIGLITAAAAVTDVSDMATVLGSMVGLGVGIDYALFVVARHREYLTQGLPVEEAAGRAVASAGQPVVFAGGTVVLAILGLVVAGVPFITVGAVGVSLIVLIMVVVSLTLLPAFLGLAGTRVQGRRRRAGRMSAVGSRRWRRWITHVTSHPRVYAVGATALLLAAAAPALSLRVGMPDDGSMPSSSTQRRAYDLVAQGFGAGANGPLVVAVDPAGNGVVLKRLTAALAADPGVASVARPEVDPRTGVAGVVVVPTTGPQREATQQTLTRLRADVLPAAVHTPARAYIGGATATVDDIGGRMNDRLPIFVAAVLVMSFVLLTFLFRSVVLPLKAVLLNLLSIGAAYGVLVLVFQHGVGASLIGLEEPVPIMSYIPMFMFAILFGLSMDYEVFLLSRVREEYLSGRDTRAAIVTGVSGTARVITSAALVMVSVFLSFVLGSTPLSKMFGFGMATAILVDATVVRTVLVPATMTLLGRANWWLPGWLDRRLPRLDAEGHEAARRPTATAVVGAASAS